MKTSGKMKYIIILLGLPLISFSVAAQRNDSLLFSFISSKDPVKFKEILISKNDMHWLKNQLAQDNPPTTPSEKEEDEKFLDAVYDRYVFETTNTLNSLINALPPDPEVIVLEETLLFPMKYFEYDASFSTAIEILDLRVSELRLKIENAGFLISFAEVKIKGSWKFFDFAKITNCLTNEQETDFYLHQLKKFSTEQRVDFPIRIINSQNNLQADIVLSETDFFQLKEKQGTKFPGFNYEKLINAYPDNSVTVSDSVFKFYLKDTYGRSYAQDMFVGKDSLVVERDSTYLISQMNTYVTDHYTHDKLRKNEFILSMTRLGVAIYNIPEFGEKFKPEDFDIIIKQN